MRSAVERQSEEAEKVVRDIRRATRRQYTAEEKVRIVIAGLRGEESIAERCRNEGINQNLYYWDCGGGLRYRRESTSLPLRGGRRVESAPAIRGRSRSGSECPSRPCQPDRYWHPRIA